LQGFTSYVNEQGCGSFFEALLVFFFPIVLTMASRNFVYIDLTANINGSSYRRYNVFQTQAASRIARIDRPGQRHAQGGSYVDLTMKAKPDLEDPPYDLDRK